MTLTEIKTVAKTKGVKPGKMKKDALIREIQTVEGNSPCFKTDISSVCGIEGCLWRKDCVK